MPRPSRAASSLALALALLAGGDRAAHADIYKFTDADGVVHFTNTPGGDKRFRVYIHGNGEGLHAGVAPGVIPFEDIDERGKRMIENTPARRGGTPAEVAEAVLYFLKADFVTGQTLTVDGGLSQR